VGETDEVIVWETGQRNGEQPGVAVANALGKAERSSDTESDAGSSGERAAESESDAGLSGERAAESESDAGLSGERVVWVESEAVKAMVSVAAGEEVGEKGNVAGLTPEASVENLGDVSDTASDTVSAAAMSQTSLQIPGGVTGGATGGATAEERVATEKSVGVMAVAPRRPG
jgi:hypothetical protein